MCTQPILIRNKKFRSLSVDTPNSFIKVPCGCCDECLRKRAKDLYIRARFEAEHTFLNGGCGFMCTLTYDNANLPYLFHHNKLYMVFNKLHVINFFKRLRINLDRFYQKHYKKDAPDFKYLVTSEFGTDPTRTHRPHYHLIILFEKNITLYEFRICFQRSLSKDFGRIFQCDPLDMKRGGLRYSVKYVLKDQTYTNQNNIIHEYIKFYSDYVASKHGIIYFPKNEAECFYNKCIRTSKQYKKDIETFVLPFRHMLQFYMCSNDFGCTAICQRYGKSLFSLGVLNIDKLPYSIPKAVIQRLERVEGSDARDVISKSVFLSQFKKIVDDSVYNKVIDFAKGETLYQFCENFVQPRYGCLYFVSPFAFSYLEKLNFLHNGIDYLDVLNYETDFYDENGFFELRNEILSLINRFNCDTNLVFRAKIAAERSKNERCEYERRKRNKPSNY